MRQQLVLHYKKRDREYNKIYHTVVPKTPQRSPVGGDREPHSLRYHRFCGVVSMPWTVSKDILLTYLSPVFFCYLQKLLRKWYLCPVSKSSWELIRDRFSMSLNCCNMASSWLQTAELPLHGWYSKKVRRLYQIAAQEWRASLWADWKVFGAGCVFRSQFHWGALQIAMKENPVRLTFQRCLV